MDISSRQARRRKVVKFDEIMDDQQQEQMISRFSQQAATQSKLYRSIFAVILAVPTPAFIFASHCRSHPKLALLSLMSLLTSIYSVRAHLQQPRLVRNLNILLSLLVAVQAWIRVPNLWLAQNLVWVFPLVAAVTAAVLDHWLKQVQNEIQELVKKRFGLHGV